MKGSWYILRTRPRAEKKLRSHLVAWRVWNVLPTCVKVRKAQRRTIKMDIPMFPGYLLAKLDEEERLRVLKTNMAVSVAPLAEVRAVLRQLHRLVKAAKATEEFRVVAPAAAGDCVRIAQGPLKGLAGRVKSADGDVVVVVNVEAFGGAVEVRVSPEDCVPA